MNQRKFLTGNQLKIIAVVAMTLDHMWAHLFRDMLWMHIAGRLAFPIFAYMLAEGCRYTKNRKKHLLTLGGMALVFQICAYVALGEIRQYILTTLFLSVVVCFVLDRAMKERSVMSVGMLMAVVIGAFVLTEVLPWILPEEYGFSVDYGFSGVMFPAVVFAANKKSDKLIAATFMTIAVAVCSAPIQWYSILAMPLIALYNGRRGKWKMKYFFYTYYPLYLIAIWLVGIIAG